MRVGGRRRASSFNGNIACLEKCVEHSRLGRYPESNKACLKGHRFPASTAGRFEQCGMELAQDLLGTAVCGDALALGEGEGATE